MYIVSGWLIPTLFILIIFLFHFLHANSLKKTLNALSPYFNGSISIQFFSAVFNGQYEGNSFFVRLDPGGKNTPPYLRICLFKSCNVTLRISYESAISFIGKKIGMVHDIKVNDELFDKRYLIYSNNPEHVGNYLRRIDLKNAVTGIFEDRFNSLDADQKGITVSKPNYNKLDDLQPMRIKSSLDLLIMIARGL